MEHLVNRIEIIFFTEGSQKFYNIICDYNILAWYIGQEKKFKNLHSHFRESFETMEQTYKI